MDPTDIATRVLRGSRPEVSSDGPLLAASAGRLSRQGGLRAVERAVDLPTGGRIWVRDDPGPGSDAPAVVLLHGLGATARITWGASYAELAKHFRVLAVDHRGHGRGMRTRRFRLEDCADDAVLAAAVLGVERVLLVGYSLGGPIALLGWRRHRPRVAGMVLAATAGRFGGTRRARIARLLLPAATLLAYTRPQRTRELLLDRAVFRLEQPGSERWIEVELEGHHLPTLLQAARAAWGFTCDGWLCDIDVPVSVVVTAEDDRIGPDRQRELAAAIPGARTWEVPGRHTACLTRADAFAPALAEACLDAWRRAVAR
jgi:3-oxoadipate enol-lactonase